MTLRAVSCREIAPSRSDGAAMRVRLKDVRTAAEAITSVQCHPPRRFCMALHYSDVRGG